MSNNMSSDPFVALFYQPHQITTTTQKPLIFQQKPVILEKIKETTQGPKETGLAEDVVDKKVLQKGRYSLFSIKLQSPKSCSPSG